MINFSSLLGSLRRLPVVERAWALGFASLMLFSCSYGLTFLQVEDMQPLSGQLASVIGVVRSAGETLKEDRSIVAYRIRLGYDEKRVPITSYVYIKTGACGVDFLAVGKQINVVVEFAASGVLVRRASLDSGCSIYDESLRREIMYRKNTSLWISVVVFAFSGVVAALLMLYYLCKSVSGG